jgi:hypothetical protein
MVTVAVERREKLHDVLACVTVEVADRLIGENEFSPSPGVFTINAIPIRCVSCRKPLRLLSLLTEISWMMPFYVTSKAVGAKSDTSKQAGTTAATFCGSKGAFGSHVSGSEPNDSASLASPDA